MSAHRCLIALQRADSPAELHSAAGIFDGHLEQPCCTTQLFSGNVQQRQIESETSPTLSIASTDEWAGVDVSPCSPAVEFSGLVLSAT